MAFPPLIYSIIQPIFIEYYPCAGHSSQGLDEAVSKSLFSWSSASRVEKADINK